MTKIKSLRLALGITQEALARKIGVSQATVSNWDSGVSLPRTKDLPTIAATLHCSIDDLFDAGGSETA